MNASVALALVVLAAAASGTTAQMPGGELMQLMPKIKQCLMEHNPTETLQKVQQELSNGGAEAVMKFISSPGEKIMCFMKCAFEAAKVLGTNGRVNEKQTEKLIGQLSMFGMMKPEIKKGLQNLKAATKACASDDYSSNQPKCSGAWQFALCILGQMKEFLAEMAVKFQNGGSF